MLPSKADIRREIRRRKTLHTQDELRRISDAVVERLLTMPLWHDARTVLLYHSLPDEVCTHSLIRMAVQGKTVLLPVVNGDDLVLRRYSADDALQQGAFNILEPKGNDIEDYAAIDLAIVPGMAFTSQGDRLGRGRGYYDRLLPRLTNATKIGLCWSFQLIDSLPTAPHDIRMDGVVTDEHCYVNTMRSIT